MKIERGENEIKVSHLFSSFTIPLLPDTEYIYGPKAKLVFVKNIVNNQLEITVYDLRGKMVDKRTYSHYFVNFFEKDGFACIKYYDYGMQSYCTGTFLSGAGITGITQI